MAPCSVDYLAGLIPQTNPPLFPEFLCSCAPPCSSQTRFCRALKQKWARDEAKHSKFSASLLWLLPLSARGETELPGFRVLKATRNSLCCAKPNNPTEGTQTATRYCQIFHSWMQCQGGLGAQQMRGKTLKTSQKPNLDLRDANTCFT